MKIETVIDYSYPYLMASKHVKAFNDCARTEDWEAALDNTQEAVRWLMEAHSALLHLKMKEER